MFDDPYSALWYLVPVLMLIVFFVGLVTMMGPPEIETDEEYDRRQW